MPNIAIWLTAALLWQQPARPPAPEGPDASGQPAADQPAPPQPGKEEQPAPIASERLKTLVDKVRERVANMEKALESANGALASFEREITGKTLGDIDFKSLADTIGNSRTLLHEVLKDADVLMGRLDREILDSMAEEEKLVGPVDVREIDPAKAARLSGTIRAALLVHDALPENSLARLSLQNLAEAIDQYLSPESARDTLDIHLISQDIIRALILYRDSIQGSLQTLHHLEQLLSVLENKSRDLGSLIARSGEAPDQAAMGRVETLLREIAENREKVIRIFEKVGRKVRDVRRRAEEAMEERGSRMEDLRNKYLRDEKEEK